MKYKEKTKVQCIDELAELRQDVDEFEKTKAERNWVKEAAERISKRGVALFHRSAVLKYFVSILLAVFMLTLCAPFLAAQNNQVKKVLVLHSYHQGLSWDDSIGRGVESVLKKENLKIDIQTEYMDTKRIYDSNYIRKLHDIYKYKFKNRRFDVIICSDNNAFNFLLKYHDELFPQTPVVFCGVNNFKDAMLKDRSLYTGTVEAIDIRETLDMALKLHQKTKHFVFYGDNSPTYLANKAILERIIPDYESSIDFIFKDNFNIREIREHIRKLPSNSLIFLISTLRDEQGQLLSFERSAEMMAAVSNVPIYGCWDFFLGHGIVGGKLISGVSQGKTAAQMAFRILSGEDISNIPVLKKSPNPFMFDYRQMQRFGLEVSDLPEGSIVINRPYSFYSEHKGWIWLIVASIAGLSLIILVLVINIIIRKRAEGALRESEEKYRTIFQDSMDAIYINTREGEFIDVNQSMLDIFGYTREEMIGLNAREIHLTTNDRPMVLNEIDQKGFFRDKEVKFKKKDGRVMDCLLTATVRRADDGSIIGYQGIIRDVTERKQAELELQREKEKFRVLIEESPCGVSIIGEDGRYKYINPKFIEIFGYTLKDIPTGREWFRKAFPDKEYRNQVISTWISDLKEKELKSGESRPRTFTMTCKDGSEKTIHFRPVAIETGDQFVIYEDITERKLLEAQLIQAQKMEAIGILAGGVAHDFNNLLQAIQGYTDISLLSVKEGNPLYRNLNEIRKASKRASSLTRQLLLFSRRQPVKFTPINLNTTVDNLLKMLQRLIGEDISINTELDSELWTVQADTGSIEQAIMNLTVNARDAMPEGGEITIKTQNLHVDEDYCKTYTYAHPGKFVCLTVEDTGIGMDKETIQHIFDPFFSTKGPGKGTGLGLSVVYGIAKQHEGWVNVYSELGQGSSLKIYLPAVSLKPEEETKETISLEIFKGSGERILLVEDEEEVREFATSALGENGYVVYEAASAEEALDIFEKEAGNFDLIFSDVVLTGKTGLELVDQLLSHKHDLRVLLSSGYTDYKSQWPVIRERGFRFLQKPYGLTDLLRAIKEAIRQDK